MLPTTLRSGFVRVTYGTRRKTLTIPLGLFLAPIGETFSATGSARLAVLADGGKRLEERLKRGADHSSEARHRSAIE
ncbi:hypothetical protein MRX96_024979 [Rhipicephalus microplus]